MTLPEGLPSNTNGITWQMWNSHPWQMWSLTALVVWALGILSDPNAIMQGTLNTTGLNNPHTLNVVAAANLTGALISLTGLHMKDREFGIGAEVSGYIVLTASMIFYLVMSFFLIGPQSFARVGTATSIGYTAAMIHRSVQILAYQSSRRKVRRLEKKLVKQIDEDAI